MLGPMKPVKVRLTPLQIEKLDDMVRDRVVTRPYPRPTASEIVREAVAIHLDANWKPPLYEAEKPKATKSATAPAARKSRAHHKPRTKKAA